MSLKEVRRASVLQDVASKRVKLKEASEVLGLSYPQTKRIWSAFKREGPTGLISKHRGRKSNRAIPEERRKEIVKIIRREFEGCKPLYISEKLGVKYEMKYSSEFIRQLMIEHHLWIPNQKSRKVHQRRERRAREGELIQMDASDHKWFEDRGPRCHLHLIMDDATGKIGGGHFMEEETTEGYFRACMPHFMEKGIPISVYTDRRGTFKANGTTGGTTQFARSMKDLGIRMIFAYSPEAKGRIERAFGTLQERLVWEMRDAQISTIEEANAFLPKFIDYYNEKYAKAPAIPSNAYRPLRQNEQLKYILCWKESRAVTKNLEISFKNTVYQLVVDRKLCGKLKRAKVEVLMTLDGEIRIEYKGERVEFRRYNEIPFAFYKEEKRDVEKAAKGSSKSKVKKKKKIVILKEREISSDEKYAADVRLMKRKVAAREENLEILNGYDDERTGDLINW